MLTPQFDEKLAPCIQTQFPALQPKPALKIIGTFNNLVIVFPDGFSFSSRFLHHSGERGPFQIQAHYFKIGLCGMKIKLLSCCRVKFLLGSFLFDDVSILVQANSRMSTDIDNL